MIIEKQTFLNCTKLNSVNLPLKLTNIGSQAFYGCRKLSKISLPNTLKYIDDEAFMWCVNLSEIYIPENVERIKDTAFRYSNVTVYAPHEYTYYGIDDIHYYSCGIKNWIVK